MNLCPTFDDAAGRFGIEKIKTFGDTYMAACGLCTPLLDHTRRAIDFAREIQRIGKRFNAEHALDLRLTVGISAGPVVAGIVGRDKFIYDVWGETVLQADLARKQGSPESIVVTTAVRDKVEALFSFRAAGNGRHRDPALVLERDQGPNPPDGRPAAHRLVYLGHRSDSRLPDSGRGPR